MRRALLASALLAALAACATPEAPLPEPTLAVLPGPEGLEGAAAALLADGPVVLDCLEGSSALAQTWPHRDRASDCPFDCRRALRVPWLSPDAITVEVWLEDAEGTVLHLANPEAPEVPVALLVELQGSDAVVTVLGDTFVAPLPRGSRTHHLALTWRASDGRAVVYDRGLPVAGRVVALGRRLPRGGVLAVGHRRDAPTTRPLRGIIDELAIYDRALPATALLEHSLVARGELAPRPLRPPLRLQPQVGNPGASTGAAFSPDGRWFVTVGAQLRVHDAASGRLVAQREVAGSHVPLAFMAEGRRVVYAQERRVLLWDVANDATVEHAIPGESPVAGLAPTPDGRTLLAVTQDGALWGIIPAFTQSSVREVYKLNINPTSIAFDPSTGRLALGTSGGELWLVELHVPQEATHHPAHVGAVGALAFSPDGLTLASGGEDRQLRLWDPNGFGLKATLDHHTAPIATLAFSPDGGLIASGGFEDAVYLTMPGSPPRPLPGHGWVTDAVAFSPDGRTLLSTGRDGVTRARRVADGAPLAAFAPPPTALLDLAIAPDGRRAALARCVAFDEARQRCTHAEVELWDLWAQRPERRLEGPPPTALAFSPDGRTLAIGSSPGPLRLIAVEADAAPVEIALPHVQGLAFAPTGTALAAATSDGTAWVELPRGRIARRLRVGGALEPLHYALAFSPGGDLLALGTSRGLVAFTPATGALARTFDGHSGEVRALAFSPDGATLASASREPAVLLHDAATGGAQGRLEGAGGLVHRLAFSPDGARLYAASLLDPPRAWTLADRAPAPLRASPGARALALHPGGRWLLTGGADDVAELIDLQGEATLRFTSARGRWVVWDDQGAFEASPAGADLLTAVAGGAPFSLDQLALHHNRPDLLLQRFPLAPDALRAAWAEHLNKRHLRRLQRLGVALPALPSPGVALPGARIVRVSEPDAQGFVTVEAEASDAEGLAAGFVRVNGVAATEAPIPLQGARARFVQRVQLASGANRLSVSVLNTRGVESLRALSEATYTPIQDVLPDLWIVALGVSRYKNPAFNLSFAHKDAQALAERLGRTSGWGRVHARVFTDAEVTRERLDALPQLLQEARPGDMLVVFIAAHGLHDAKGDFYILPWEGDPADLPHTALPFDAIEQLLQRAAPRRRLLLLDACESGDPDPDATDRAAAALTLKARTLRGFERAPTTPAGSITAWPPGRLDRLVYVDLDRSAGAIVLASSSGDEPSFESPDAQHGLFTDALLRALDAPDTDADHDGTLSPRELIRAVHAEVATRTHGLQNPTLDRDNLEAGVGFGVPARSPPPP